MIIFDLDGTMWDPTERGALAWNRALEKFEDVDVRVSRGDLKAVMGLTAAQIMERLFPMLSAEATEAVLAEILREEQIELLEHGGELYPELERVLTELSAKYPLYIISNCEEGYIETFLDAHGLHRYFQDYECSGRTGRHKGENIKLLMERNSLQFAVYVGDTQGDYLATLHAGVPFIYAAYGLGSAEGGYAINSISELPAAVEAVMAMRQG